MATASKSSSHSFDDNLCLNCSTEFVKDGEILTTKLSYLEVIDESSVVKFEAVSVPSAINLVFKLPVSLQIPESDNLTYGCCPECAIEVGRLYEIHRKLEQMRTLNSAISNILKTKESELQAKSSSTQTEVVSNDVDARVSSGSKNATSQAISSDFCQPLCNTNKKRKLTLQLQCANCCTKLHLGAGECPAKKRRAVVSAVIEVNKSSNEQKKVGMSFILNSILKLPQKNPWTKDIMFCVTCARVILQMFELYTELDTSAESHLNSIFRDIGSIFQTRSNPLVPSGHPKPSPSLVTPTPIVIVDEINLDMESQSPSHPPLASVPKGRSRKKGRAVREERMAKIRENAKMRYSNQPLIKHGPCPHCGKVFQNRIKDWMERHIKVYHEGNLKSTWACETCGKPYYSRAAMQIHAYSHLNAAEKKVLTLEEEEKMAKLREYKLKELAKCRERNRLTPAMTHDPCPHCGKVFVNKNRKWMEHHIKFSHKHVSNITCNICGRPLRSLLHKTLHVNTHLNAAERLQKKLEEPPTTFLCTECGKVLSSEYSLKIHSRLHEDAAKRKLHCKETECEFTCFNKGTLRKHHTRVHDQSVEPKFQCKMCNKKFRQYMELKEHEMVSCDSPNRPFACDQNDCSRRFRLKHALLHHLHSCHTLTPEEAREKLYPGLPCPDWVGKKRIHVKDKRKNRKRKPY